MHDCVLLFLLSVTWGDAAEMVIARNRLLPRSLSQLFFLEKSIVLSLFLFFIEKNNLLTYVYYWQGSDGPCIVYDVESHSADFCCFSTITL